MTVDEALSITETALNFQNLTTIQKIVFRHVWEGKSYDEIAKDTGYDYDYIKDSAAKLWQLLSDSFGEKVKKKNLQSVVKRYVNQQNMNFHRNQVIEVNLTDTQLTNANFNVINLSSDFSQADLQRQILPNNYHQNFTNNPNIYEWKGWHFNSEAPVKIAHILDKLNLLFFPKSKLRLTTNDGRDNQEFTFLIFAQGKWGILDVLEEHQENTMKMRDRTFLDDNIPLIKYYSAQKCYQEPELVVQDFLLSLCQSVN